MFKKNLNLQFSDKNCVNLKNPTFWTFPDFSFFLKPKQILNLKKPTSASPAVQQTEPSEPSVETKSYRAARRYAPPPRRSRRIYVRVHTDPQSAQLWWPGLNAARLASPGGTDRQTDGRTDGRTDGSRHRLMLRTAGT